MAEKNNLNTPSGSNDKVVEPAETQTSKVVVGMQKSPNIITRFFRHKWLVLATFVAIVLIGVLVSVGLVYRHNQQVKRDKLAAVSKEPLENQTPEEVKATLDATEGLDIDKLKSGPITSGTYNSSAQAYKAAQALNAVGSYDKAVASYEIAAQKPQSYLFYFDYSAAADAVNNTKLGTELLQKARDVLQSDSSIDASKKETLTQEIDQKLKFRKLNNI